MPTRVLADSSPTLSWPQRKATMLEWQGNESRIQKVKLHSYIAYRIVGVGLWRPTWISTFICFQGIGPMEEAHLLLVIHWNRGITTAINP
jgi:hypothetical protein